MTEPTIGPFGIGIENPAPMPVNQPERPVCTSIRKTFAVEAIARNHRVGFALQRDSRIKVAGHGYSMSMRKLRDNTEAGADNRQRVDSLEIASTLPAKLSCALSES